MADQVTTSLAQAKVLVMQGMKGEDGKSLRVNSAGHVEYWDDETQQWVDTGIEVEGVPGPQGPQGPKGDTGATGPTGATGTDGYSPVVTVTNITGGHRVSITDKTHPSGQNFDVMDGSSDFVLLRMDANGYVYNGTTAITGTQINTLAASRKAVFLWDEDSECLYTYNVPYNDAAIFTAPSYNKGGVTNKVTVNASDNEATFNAIAALPTVTTTDNGKFLRVVSGAWAAAAVPSAESVSFGGGA